MIHFPEIREAALSYIISVFLAIGNVRIAVMQNLVSVERAKEGNLVWLLRETRMFSLPFLLSPSISQVSQAALIHLAREALLAKHLHSCHQWLSLYLSAQISFPNSLPSNTRNIRPNLRYT